MSNPPKISVISSPDDSGFQSRETSFFYPSTENSRVDLRHDIVSTHSGDELLRPPGSAGRTMQSPSPKAVKNRTRDLEENSVQIIASVNDDISMDNNENSCPRSSFHVSKYGWYCCVDGLIDVVMVHIKGFCFIEWNHCFPCGIPFKNFRDTQTLLAVVRHYQKSSTTLSQLSAKMHRVALLDRDVSYDLVIMCYINPNKLPNLFTHLPQQNHPHKMSITPGDEPIKEEVVNGSATADVTADVSITVLWKLKLLGDYLACFYHSHSFFCLYVLKFSNLR